MLGPEVKSHMTGEPISIEPDSSALAALDLMVEHGIRHLPVVDPSRRVCGVLSFDDLRAALPVSISLRVPPSMEERSAAQDLLVGEVMTYSPVTILYNAPLEEAAQAMAEGRFGCLPVVDEKGLLDGVLSETDLLYALVTVLWAERGVEPAPRPVDLAGALETERDHLVRKLAAYGQHERELTATEREIPLDRAEIGTALEDGFLTEQLAELAAGRLRAIEHALEREERGELSTCERCQGRIPDARLRATPGTTLCVRCARESEAKP